MLCSDGLWSTMDDENIAQIIHDHPLQTAIDLLLDSAESIGGKLGDNLSAIGMQWGDNAHNKLAISTATMALGTTTTIINPAEAQDDGNNHAGNAANAATQLSDEDIEKAIADIQAALRKSQRSPNPA